MTSTTDMHISADGPYFTGGIALALHTPLSGANQMETFPVYPKRTHKRSAGSDTTLVRQKEHINEKGHRLCTGDYPGQQRCYYSGACKHQKQNRIDHQQNNLCLLVQRVWSQIEVLRKINLTGA